MNRKNTISIDQDIEYAVSDNWIENPALNVKCLNPQASDEFKFADVFYVYPTVSDNDSFNMDIENKDERALAMGVFKSQASVFAPSAQIYAPYYRQMTKALELNDDEDPLQNLYFKYGERDVINAFKHYMENYNEGRPFIIAGHSQGTMTLIGLIKDDYFKHPNVRNLFVSAYLIGYTITDNDLKIAKLGAAKGETDLKSIISYNTQWTKADQHGDMLIPPANCINPLNWRTDNIEAPKEMNLGSRFYDDETGEFKVEIKHLCNAKIVTKRDEFEGALSTNLNVDDYSFLTDEPFGHGIYHRYDYALWYRNLQENARKRIIAFEKAFGHLIPTHIHFR
ncbi:MAG: DUF3089 domain-containing protein [Bacteroidales bacterium]